MPNQSYDLIILGAGPAGITASVYASRKGIKFIVVSKDVGGQAAWSSDVENYTGFQFITGADLTEKFKKHLESFKADLRIPEEIMAVKKEGGIITVTTDKSEYLSKSIVIATGKKPRPLGVKGEEDFKNKGLAYCATCDGPLFRGKDVAVIGGGNSALDAALQLVEFCPKVYIVNISESLTGDSVVVDKIKGYSNVEIINNAEVKSVYGDLFVKGIEVESKGTKRKLVVEGVFVEIGLIPNSSFIDIVEKNKYGEIIVNCNNQTNIEGIFAAGDVTSVAEKQIIIACGEGAKAMLGAFKYLSRHNFN